MAYLHGYSQRETQRLYEQSVILEGLLHDDLQFRPGTRLLEAGCGVGAQTKIIMKRNKNIDIEAIDISGNSLKLAQKNVDIMNGNKIRFSEGNIMNLSFPDDTFDHVFVCFLLEHLPDPVQALRELGRVLKPGGSIVVIEGDHGSCFWYPETVHSKSVWELLIKLQQKRAHDPKIGRRLFYLLTRAGFRNAIAKPKWVFADQGNPALLDDVVNKIIVPMINASTHEIIENKYMEYKTWNEGLREMSAVGKHEKGSFFYSWFQCIANK